MLKSSKIIFKNLLFNFNSKSSKSLSLHPPLNFNTLRIMYIVQLCLDVSVRTEVTADFQRLNLLLLRAGSGKRIGTALLTDAREADIISQLFMKYFLLFITNRLGSLKEGCKFCM